jgi:hypothetical protein
LLVCKVARNCRSGMSAHLSRLGAKRTSVLAADVHPLDGRATTARPSASTRPAQSGQTRLTGGARQQSVTFIYFARCRSIFHTQSRLLNVPSNLSSMKFPVRGCQPIVAPKLPSSRTVPLMFGASIPNRAWPVTSRPWTVSVTVAGLHRPTVDVPEPVHSPSNRLAAQASPNCARSSM